MKIERHPFYNWVEKNLMDEFTRIPSEAVSALKAVYRTDEDGSPMLVLRAVETGALIELSQRENDDAISIIVTFVPKESIALTPGFTFRFPVAASSGWGTFHLAKWLVLAAERVTHDDTHEVFQSKIRELTELDTIEVPIATKLGEFGEFEHDTQYV